MTEAVIHKKAKFGKFEPIMKLGELRLWPKLWLYYSASRASIIVVTTPVNHALRYGFACDETFCSMVEEGSVGKMRTR